MKTPMRILHVLPSLDPKTGGPARTVPLLCRGLAEAGAKVTLFSMGSASEGRELHLHGMDVQTFSKRGRGHAAWSRSLLRAVALACGRCDVLHVHSLWNPTATLSMRIARGRRQPYVLSPRGMLDPEVLNRRAFFKGIYALCLERKNVSRGRFLHFTTTSEESRARGTRWPFPRVRIIANPMDLSAWRPGGSPEPFTSRLPRLKGKKMVLYVGRLSWVKNLSALVDGIARIKDERPQLVLVGPDPEGCEDALKRQAQELALGDRVHFAGMLDGPMLLSAYAAADVFVLPSRKEGFGMAAAEAMACGVPTVLSSGVGIAEAASAADGAEIADRPEEIACTVARLLRDELRRNQLAENGSKFIRDLCDWKRVGREMLSAYEEAVS